LRYPPARRTDQISGYAVPIGMTEGAPRMDDVNRCIVGRCIGGRCPCLCHVESPLGRLRPERYELINYEAPRTDASRWATKLFSLMFNVFVFEEL